MVNETCLIADNGGQKTFFNKERNCNYLIDRQNYVLTEIDYYKLSKKVKELRKLFGEINIKLDSEVNFKT